MTLNSELVDQLQSELKFSRVECCRNRTEVAGPEIVADAAIVVVTLELGVVPGVKSLHTELDSAPSLLADLQNSWKSERFQSSLARIPSHCIVFRDRRSNPGRWRKTPEP